MFKRLAFAAATAFALALAAAPASAASFDCAKARAPHEKAICADPQLSLADAEMARVYRQAQALAPASTVKQDQRAWLSRTRACAADTACLSALYRARIDALRSQALSAFLTTYLHDPAAPAATAWTDLNGDARAEAVVQLSGPNWCGSGGCTLVVLEPTADSFTVRGRITLTRAPVAVLDTTTKGWCDLMVGAGGGGAPSGQAVLPFQGQRYPANPTVAPARAHTTEPTAQILFDGR